MKKVYIKGLIMPRACAYCKFLIRCDSEDKYLCGLNYEFVEKSITERNKFCPLREARKETNNLTDFSKVKVIDETRNISEFHDVDGFKCEKCGVEIIDYSRREIDEDNGEETHFEYTMKYCPECGRKVEE